MIKLVIPYIIILSLFLLLDIPVILYINRSMYDNQFNRINLCSNNSILNYRKYISGIIAYFLLTLCIYIFIVKPEINNYKQDYNDIIIRGMILGLVVYGVYNTTNLVTIKEWGLIESIVDTIWGSFLFGLISGLSI